MSAKKQSPAAETSVKLEVEAARSVDEVTAQVHLEYALYIEKRNSVRDLMRKENGRLRRSQIHSQLAS